LKTLEKINRKGNRNSRKKEKAISAQTSPLSPARARAPSVPDRRAPPIGAKRAVSAVLSPHALSLCPAVPTCQSSLTSRPRYPRRGRAHDCAFFGHARAPTPLLSLTPCSPTSPRSFAHCAKPPRPLSRSAHASIELRHRPPRRPQPVLRPPSRPRLVPCHGEFRLAISCSGYPLVCTSPLCFVRSALTRAIFAQPEPRRRRPVASLHLRRCFATPVFPLKVSDPPVPLIWSFLLCCSRDCSPELSCAAVSPPRHGLCPLVPLRQREGHGRVR
jgi:hypothetical protein